MAYRTILYRGKSVDNNKWVYGSLIWNGSFIAILEREEDVHPSDYPYLDSNTGAIDGKATIVNPDTIGQYTGFDTNGVKVFEGDILQTIDGNYEVYFDDGDYEFCLRRNTRWGITKYEHLEFLSSTVVGNIIDTPELLEE